MPSKKYLHDIDLVQNQLLNAVLDSRSSAPSSGVDGQIYYNNASKQFFYYNGTTSLWEPIGGTSIATEARQLIREVYNNSGATMTKGTVVYINSGHGNLPTIAKALATGDATSAQTYGVVQNDISDNSNGYIVVIGDLLNIDTQAFAIGTQLYLSGTTAGAYTSTKQYAPIHLVYVGIVTRSHPTQGVIAVKIQNGYEMDELHDVSAQNPSNNDILQYKTATGLWTKVAGTTANISEVTNLYFTDARARLAISLTTTGSSGAATYSNTTGVLNIPTYTLAGLGGLTNPMTTLGDIIYGGTSGAVTRLAGNITTTRQFLSQTGTGSASAAPAWATIAGSDITGAALTSSNDTNVTITLGGTPATSLLRAASLTLGWTGTLAVSRGGTGLGSLGTANQLIRVNAGATALEYFTPTYLTANQSITLSGDVTGTGTTAITATIANNAVTLAKFQQIATSSFLGRITAATGNIEVITGTQATTLLDSFTGSIKGLVPVSVGGTTNFLRADGTWAAPPGGGGGSPAGSNTQIQYNNSGAFGASSNLTWDGSALSSILYKTTVATAVNTVYDAIILQNTTAATSASNVGYSPAIHFKGTGWPTPGSSSVPIDMRLYLTSNSFAQASARIVLDYSSNGSAYKDALVVDASTSFNSTLLRLIAPGAGSVLETQGAAVLFTNITSGQHDIIFGDGTVAYFSFRTDASTTKMSIRNFTGGSDLLTVFRTSGNVVIANTTDNGVDKLQVSGSAIATRLKVNTSGQTIQINNFYNGGNGNNIWIGGGGASSTSQAEGNVSLGVDALLSNTSGYYNTAIGGYSLRTNTSGYVNDAFGFNTLYSNTSGYRNVAFGAASLYGNTTGYENMGIGHLSLAANTTGFGNVAVGAISMANNTTGSSNIAFGRNAGTFVSGGGNLTTPSQSIFIGEDTRPSANGNTNEMVFGHNAIGQGSNSVTLGNSSITQTLLRGTVTAGSYVKSGGTSSQVLYADGSTKQITSGTAAPTGGNDGDIYLQYV